MEDEPVILVLISLVLRRAGYQVVPTETAAEALNFVNRSSGRIDLILTDLSMPGMNGAQLVKSILVRSPNSQVLYMTGHSPATAIESGVPEGADIIRKPFLPRDLVARVHRALAAFNSLPQEFGTG